MAFLSKRALGIIFPIMILIFFLFLYFAWAINLYFTYSAMFSTGGRIVLSIIWLIVMHILVGLVTYCYLYTMCTNPGEPPQYWGFYYDSPEIRKQRYTLFLFFYSFKTGNIFLFIKTIRFAGFLTCLQYCFLKFISQTI